MVVLSGVENVEKELGITGYSIKWVLSTLEKCCDDYVKAKGKKKVADIDAIDVSEGKGYLSRVFVTTIKFDDQSIYKIALKVPTYTIIEDKVKEMGDFENFDNDEGKANIDKAHDIECDAISFVDSFPNFPSPKVYYTLKCKESADCGLKGKQAPGIIIMEALDGASIGIVRSVTVEQCLNFALDFATLQNYVAQAPEEKWKTKFDSTLHFDKSMFDAIKPMLKKVKEEFPEELTEICEILDSIDIKAFSEYGLIDRPAELNALTYVHGDSWTNNVMFKKNPDGSVGDEALAYIDYQIGFVGSPLFDIARFLTLCADAEIRREIEAKTLQVYYQKLTELFEKRGQKVPLTFQEVEELYDLAYIQQTYEFIIIAVFMANDDALTPEVLEARTAKLKMRTRFALLDAGKIWKKRNFSNLVKEKKFLL